MPQPKSKLESVLVKKRPYSIKGTEVDPDKRLQHYNKSKKKYVDPTTQRWQKERYPKQVDPFSRDRTPPQKIILSPAQQAAAKKGEPLPVNAEDIRYIYKHGGSDSERILSSIQEYNTTIAPIKVKKKKDKYYPYVLEGRKHKPLTKEQSFGFTTEERAREAGMRHLGYDKKEIGGFRSIQKGGFDPNAPVELPRKVVIRQRASEQSRIAEWQRTATFKLNKNTNKYVLKFKKDPPLDVRKSLKEEGKYDKKTNTYSIPNTPLNKNWLSTNFGAEKRPIGYLKPDEAKLMSQARKRPSAFMRKKGERAVLVKKAKRVKKERRIKRNTRWYYKKTPRSRKIKRIHRDSKTGESLILEKWKRTGDTGGMVLIEVTNPTSRKQDEIKIRNNDPSVKFYK